MPGQKGSLLDKIKAFFIRRRQNNLKKKEQERKDLEEILKKISDKVIPTSGMIVRVGVATDKINLKKVSLNPIENEIHIIKNIHKKESMEPIVDEKQVKSEIEEILDFDEMNISNLKRLKSNIISSRGSSHENIANVERNIIIDLEGHKNDKEDLVVNKVIEDKNTIDKDVVVDNSKKVIDNPVKEPEKIDNNKIMLVSNKKLKINPNKSIKVKNTVGLNILPSLKSKKDKNKNTEQELSALLLRMIDKNLYEINYFKDEIELLKDYNNNAKTKEEIEQVEQRFLILKERLDAVYNEFLEFKNNNVFDNTVNYNEELVELVEKYKLEVYDSESIDQMLVDIENNYKKSLNVLESIVVLEESKEVLGDEIYKNKNDISVRDGELELTTDVIEKIDFMKEELDANVKYNRDIVNSVISKVNSIKPEERVNYQYNIVKNLVNSAINFSFSFAMLNPRRGRLSNALGALTMLNGVRLLSHAFDPKKEIYFVASSDFEDEIKMHLNDFSYVKKNIDLSIEEIDSIKSSFNSKFGQYIDVLPEVYDTMNSINKLQNQLKDIKVEMNIQEAKLNESLVKNNEIIKKIEYNN